LNYKKRENNVRRRVANVAIKTSTVPILVFLGAARPVLGFI
jgi:hypothetical protein